MTKEIAKPLPSSIMDLVHLEEADVAALDFRSLPTIVNDGEVLKVREAPWKLDGADGFEAIPLVAEEYSYYKCSNETHAIPGFYAVGDTTRNGEAVTDLLKMWADDGCTATENKYIGVRVVITEPGEAFNALAIVTISPTAVDRFKAFISLEVKRQRQLQPFQVVMRFGQAKKAVKGRGGKMFLPWRFEFVREATADELTPKKAA